MKELSQYTSHYLEINSLNTTDAALAVNNQLIHHLLERIEYLRDSIKELKKQFWGFVDDYQRVFLQPRYALGT